MKRPLLQSDLSGAKAPSSAQTPHLLDVELASAAHRDGVRRTDVPQRPLTQPHEHEAILLGTLAHELRNPLGPLNNAARIIRTAAPDDPRIAAAVEVIERQVRFIEKLIDDLLETTRAFAGKINLHCEPLRLLAIVERAIETCSAELAERRQEAVVLVPDTLELDADAVRLQQVLVNLIGNASKFSPAGSKVWIRARAEGADVVLAVEDQGRGIAPELLPRVFELFTQAGEGDIVRPGLGIGLAVVKVIVEMHGGSVQVKSDGVGKGARVTVALPLKQPHVRHGTGQGSNTGATEQDGCHGL